MTDVLNDFLQDGFVFCRRFCKSEMLRDVEENLQRVIRDTVPGLPPEHKFYEDRSDTSTLKQIQHLELHDRFFGGLMETGRFRALAEALLGEQVVCKNLQYFNKPPGVGQATPPHQDGYYFKLDPCEAVTMWMALDSVDEENGCVRYVRGSHLLGMRPHGSTGTLGFSQGITDFPGDADCENEKPFPAEPGDLLAHHALTIHRADENKSSTRTRRALGFIYYAASAKEDSAAHTEYQAQLKHELSKAGKI